jgi:hypothetical protein
MKLPEVSAGVNPRSMPSPLAVLAQTGGFWEENPAVVGRGCVKTL